MGVVPLAVVAAVAVSTAALVPLAGAATVNSVSLTGTQLDEGTGGTAVARFTFRFSRLALGTERVFYETVPGSAHEVDDFQAVSGSFAAVAGQTSQVVEVPVVTDDAEEPDETFDLRIVRTENTDATNSAATATVLNDDGLPASVAVAAQNFVEGDESSQAGVIVTLSHAVRAVVSAAWATEPGTAGPEDFTGGSGRLTFMPGEIAKVIGFDLHGDRTAEPAETFSVRLSEVNNAVGGNVTADMTILDDDGRSGLSVGDVRVLEGTGSPSAAVFDVVLTPASLRTVTVSYATAREFSLHRPRPLGYTPVSGSLSFPPGTTVQQVSVPVDPDAIDEFDEIFFLNIFGPTNAALDDPQARAVIEDDDAEPAVVLSDATTTEGAGAVLAFEAGLAAPSGKDVSFTVTALPGTAGADDFDPTPTTVRYRAYDPDTTVTVPVAVVDDALDEDDESLTFVASAPVNASLPAGGATGQIVDDDPSPSLSVADITVGELDEADALATLDVRLSAPSGRAVSIGYATASDPPGPGVAAAGSDYIPATGTLVIPAGDTAGSIDIVIPPDDVDEDDESFIVQWSDPVAVVAPGGPATVTIVDADAMVNVSVGDVTAVEGTGTEQFAVLPVTLSGPSERIVSVDFSTAPGSAVPPQYRASTGTVTFGRGETSKAISIRLKPDAVDEFDLDFAVGLSNPANAVLADADARVTILDDDDPPVLILEDGSVLEQTGADVMQKINNARLSAPSGKPVSVHFVTRNGTARAGDDYVSRQTRLDFLAGTRKAGMYVKPVGDALDEADETLAINFYRGENVVLPAQPAMKVTIIDDDDPVAVSVGDTEVHEGNTSAVDAFFTVSLSTVSGQPVNVDYRAVSGSAVEGDDFAATSGTLTVPAGHLAATFPVSVLADTIAEGEEIFTVEISNPVNATIATGVGTGRILDDD